MPTYEYRCNACGSRFEEFQKMSDAPIEECPECGEPEAERLISAGAGVVFRGSGFYETDYKRAGGGDGSPEDSASSEGEGGDGDSAGSGESSSTEAGGAGES